MTIFNMVWLGGGQWGNIWEPLNLTITLSGLDATITWEDNEIWTIPPTSFAKSELVRKVWSAPTSPSDWTLVVTETVKDTYKNTWYVDSWLTGGTTYYYRVFSYSDTWGISYCDAESITPTPQRQPWANTIGYYPLDWDILNHATTWATLPDGLLDTASFSSTEVHWNNTKALYCDWSTSAYLPQDIWFAFWTSDFTISVWVYSETNSWSHPWFISNYLESPSTQWELFPWGYRISDRFNSVNRANWCWRVWDWGYDAWSDNYTSDDMNDWLRHNVILTRNSWTFTFYLDWVLKLTNSSYPTASFGRNNRVVLWRNFSDNKYSKVYMNDLIFENVWWSAQDVSDYYNSFN